jgi:hypothetical protein
MDANAGNTPGALGTTAWALLAAKGDAGAAGAAGADGHDGAAATVQVGTVTTVAAGASAQVQNTGTANAAVLNFKIPQGTAGADGARGMTYRGTWSASTGYVADDAVFYNGSTYIALSASSNANPATDVGAGSGKWAVLAQQGATGAAGPATVSIGTVSAGTSATVTNSGTSNAAVLNFTLPKGDKGDTGAAGLTYRGTWSAAFSYSPNDAATYNGTTYIAKLANTNVNPATDVAASGTSWAVLAAQGSEGTSGATGAQGPSGSAATVSIGTVTTGAAGTDASVTNSGTSSAAILNFTIPRGDAGTGGGASGGAVFTALHPVTGGLSGMTYYNPVNDERANSEGALQMAYFPACTVSGLKFKNTSSSAVTVDFRTGTAPGSMATVSGATCTVAANAITTCTGPGALSADSLMDFKMTTSAAGPLYVWSSFTCQ